MGNNATPQRFRIMKDSRENNTQNKDRDSGGQGEGMQVEPARQMNTYK